MIDWSAIYCKTDVNVSYELFIHKLSRLYFECFPLINVKRKKYDKPWITNGISKSIKKKQRLYCRYLKKGDISSRNKYVGYKNILTGVIRQRKKIYYFNLFKNVKGDMKKTWSQINKLLGKRKKSIPSHMYYNQNKVLGKASVAEAFNNYFVDIGKITQEKIPIPSSHFHDYLFNRIPVSLFFNPTSHTEIINVLSSMKSSASPGSDCIAARVVKACIHSIVNPLCFIFNESMSQGTVPDKLKTAMVIPIYKKGDKHDIANYRPIALLPFFFKKC